MSDDKRPNARSGQAGDPPGKAPSAGDRVEAAAGDPPAADRGATEVDLLHRAACEIRASASLQALVPLSVSEREQLADQALTLALGAAGARAEPAVPTASSASSDAAATIPVIGAARRPRRFRARTVGAIAAAAVALAAAAVVVVRGGLRPEPALAAYAMVVEGEQHARGASDPHAAAGAPVRLRPETRLVVTLTAEQPDRDALLRVVLVRHGRAAVLDPPIARSRAGVLEIAGPAAELLGPQSDGPADGPAELVVVLGRALPGDDEVRALALRAAAEAPRELQVLRRALVLEGFSHTAIDVLLGGCSAVLAPAAAGSAAPPRCELAARALLHLWIGVPSAAVAVELDGRAVAQRAVARAGGSAFDVEVPALAGSLSVRVDDREVAAWQLAPAPVFARVQASDDARKAGRLDEAAAELDAIAPGGAGEERLEVVRRRAKLDRLRGEVGRERAWRDQAVALARSLGRLSVESDETVAILYGLVNDHALTQAAQLLPVLDAHGTSYAEGAVHRELIRGQLASELGDLGAALGAFQRGLTIADRIADTRDRAMLLAPLADVLQSLGRDAEAIALIDAEIERGRQDADPCARVDALTSAGWLLRDRDLPRAQRLADQAAALAAVSCERLVAITLVNRGWLLATARRFAGARAVLDQIAGLPGAREDRVTTWALRLEAETVLGEDPARAEHHARALAARAAELCSSELLYEAQLLRARALALLGRADEATAAFAAADRALTLWSRLVPLGEGRATFFERHDELARHAIPLLRDQARRGTPGARLALAVTVRHSLARFVASLAGGGRARALAERGAGDRDHTSRQFEQTLDRWPARPGTTPRPGDAVAGVCAARDAAALAPDDAAVTEAPANASVFVHPAPHSWLVLAWRRAAIDFTEIPRGATDEDGAALSARIANAAAAMLVGAPRVHLYVHRSLAALPIDRSLAALLGVPVAFAVDAPARTQAGACGDRRALVVANPQRNLWAASEAVPVIRADLERMGFVVDTLEGGAATRAAVQARLSDPCTTLFHYDGHGLAGTPRAAAGQAGQVTRDRTDDALILAGGDTLTAADVLRLPRAPAAVVLNGCTTAAPEGLGLAQAFLLAGAAQVVASLDEIPAEDAARFTRKLFAHAPSGPAGPDLVSLFARATADGDVSALRVFVR